MKMEEQSVQNIKMFLWKRAAFPAVMSLCAFICFGIVYWSFAQAIDPIYLLLGLALVIPGLVFFCIAFLAGKNKLKAAKTRILTIIFIPVFLIGSFYYVFILSLSATSVTVTDSSRYERTIRLGGHSWKEQLSVFPKAIPDNSSNVVFYYSESMWQEYDQTVVLSFSAGKEMIGEYAGQFERVAVKAENASKANVESIYDRVAENYIKGLSADYVIYTIINEGSHNRKVCAVAVSGEQNHIIFYAYEMRW